MPARSKIEQLPKDIRAEFDKRIVDGGFANYRTLTKWLNDQGFEIRKSAVARHGHKLEEKLQAIKIATEQARAIADASPDDDAKMNDALMRLVQQKLFEILMDLEEVDIEGLNFPALARSIAELGRASVAQKKWMLEVRDKVASKVAAAKEKIAEVSRAGGLSAEATEQIRNALLDIRV